MRFQKFIVYPGNNSFVIRDALLKRGNWKEQEFISQCYYLLFQVLYDDSNIDLAEIDFIWSPNSFSLKYILHNKELFNILLQEYEKLLECQKNNPNHKMLINHFENHTSLTTKSDMIKALDNYYKKNVEAVRVGYNTFHSTPASYVLVVGQSTVDLRDFQIKYNEIKKGNFKRCTLPEKHCAQNVWILKPENQSQGKGIEIFQDLKSIHCFLHYRQQFSKWVIQKYIEKPLLYNGRKFDLRVWVLFTNKGELFVYKDGYLRTSSSKYSMQNFNEAVHLTNWSLQKGMQNYEKHELGNRLPLKEGLQHIFNTQYGQYNVDYEKHIYPRMKDLIIDLVRSCEGEMFSSKKLNNCFELFGFDFIIDEDLRCWLIEANRNPGFGLPTDKAKQLIDDMVEEMLQLTVDYIFPPKAALEPRKGTFDLIYTMKPSPFNRFQPKNDRRSFNLSVYPIKELEPQTGTGDKRFQVHNPVTEYEYKNMIEKQQKLDNDFMNKYKSSQGRSITCSSEFIEIKDPDMLSDKSPINSLTEVQMKKEDSNEKDQKETQSNEQDDQINFQDRIKLPSRSIHSRKEYFNSLPKIDDNAKQMSLDFDSKTTNFSSNPFTNITQQPSLSRVCSIVLMSPRMLDPLPQLPKNKLETQQENLNSIEDILKKNISPTSSKVTLEPLNQTKIKRNILTETNDFQKINIRSNLRLQDDLTKTQNNRFNQSPERRQFINRSYNRSLMKIKQLNDQAKLIQQLSDYSKIQIKGNLTKSLSTNQLMMQSNLKQKTETQVFNQPYLSSTIYPSVQNNNENSKQPQFQKDGSTPHTMLSKENVFYQKPNVTSYRLQ